MQTPHEEYPDLARAIGTERLYFKREDLHPFGSHKGRSIPYMIDVHLAQMAENGYETIPRFAISSSGNAALAAALYIKELNKKRVQKNDNPIELEILVGKHISNTKLEHLESLTDESIKVSIVERPLQTLFVKTQEDGYIGLRQSNDDTALVGYASLATELLEIPHLKAVFIGTSSGTTAQALASFFAKNKKNIEVHIVQTISCHPIADAFEDIEHSEVRSIADAIVDQTAFRKDTLVPLIEKSKGHGWAATNEALHIAQDLTKKHTGLAISSNSALSVAGVMEAVYTGRQWNGAVACIICGA